MKKELFLAIVTAIVGTVVGFTVVNIFAGSIEPFTITTLYPSGDSATEAADYSTLEEPNPDIFNYKSINPTVEVYVGDGSSTTIIVPENENQTPENETPENPESPTDTPEEEV